MDTDRMTHGEVRALLFLASYSAMSGTILVFRDGWDEVRGYLFLLIAVILCIVVLSNNWRQRRR